MWKLLGIIFINFSVAFTFRNESFEALNIVEIFKNKDFTNVNEECQNHLRKYIKGIVNRESWAFQMIDSMTKFPDGVLMGHLIIPGHFDECVNVVYETFSGKHCMADLQLKAADTTFSSRSSAQDRYNNFVQAENNDFNMRFSYGICFPSSCNASEIESVIGSVDELKNFLTVNVTEEQCSINEFRPFRSEDWITVGVIVFICLLAAGSSFYDLFQRFKIKNDNPSQLWSSFSVYSNGKQLFRISQSSSQLKCLHGIRFLSMTWVILAHAYFAYMFGAPVNFFDISKFMSDKSFVPVSNGFVSVDSFFFLSGLLVCLVFFRDISKKGSFDVPVAFIHRYMRLTPPFAILMLIQATILSRIGNGPFWNKSTDLIESFCRESWWTGLLYLQNFLKPRTTCLGQSWYLSADMQMYWVSPFILYPLLWLPSLAPYFLLFYILVASLANFTIAYVNKLAPSLFVKMGDFSSESVFINQFELEYIPFYTRMAPWLIGVATGYIICGIQAKKIQFSLSKFWVVVGWMVGGALLGGSLFGIIRFISTDYSQAESSLYLAFHRVGWALGLSWVVVACVSGYGGVINDFLSWDFFQPLAKLSYCNFLIHMALQNYRINSSRLNQYLRHFDIVFSYFGDLVVSNLISIPVVLLFEFPFTNLDRHFLQKLTIFPLPRPKNKMEKRNLDEKSENPVEPSKDVEEGKVNPTFVES